MFLPKSTKCGAPNLTGPLNLSGSGNNALPGAHDNGEGDGILETRPDVDEKIQRAVFLEDAGTHQRRVASPKRGGCHEFSDRLGLGEIGIRLVQIEIEAAAVDAAGALSEVGVGDLASVAAEVRIAHVIGEDEQDVGFRRSVDIPVAATRRLENHPSGIKPAKSAKKCKD